MSIFKDKLNKKLYATLVEHKLEEPKLIQAKLLPRINGGSDVVGVGPDGVGKSTLLAIACMNTLKDHFEDAPRALVILPDPERVLQARDQYKLLSIHTELRIRVAYEGGKIEQQGEEIYMGCDIVIATPKRAFDLYLRQNLNMNKLKIFALDDADLMIKNEFQGQIDRLIHSIPKCQHLVFTSLYNEKVEKLISKFIINPTIVEVEA